MAQHVWKKAAAGVGTGIDGVVAASNATNISTDLLWVIVAADVTRDQTIAMLKDVLYKIESGSTTFPGA